MATQQQTTATQSAACSAVAPSTGAPMDAADGAAPMPVARNWRRRSAALGGPRLSTSESGSMAHRAKTPYQKKVSRHPIASLK